MVRYQVEVKGHVQGVGFRAFVSETAKKYQVTGTVMNRAEGSVEIVAQGEAEELTAFLADVKKGNSFSTVSTLTKKRNGT